MKKSVVRGIVSVVLILVITLTVYFVKIAPLLAPAGGCYCDYGMSAYGNPPLSTTENLIQQCRLSGGIGLSTSFGDCESKANMCSKGSCKITVSCKSNNLPVNVPAWGNSPTKTVEGECKAKPVATSRPSTRPATATQPVGGGGN